MILVIAIRIAAIIIFFARRINRFVHMPKLSASSTSRQRTGGGAENRRRLTLGRPLAEGFQGSAFLDPGINAAYQVARVDQSGFVH